MGKKKPQKTKELSVAIAEASSTGEESKQQQTHPQLPRKRGRPRKIVENITETAEKKEHLIGEEATQGTDASLKKAKASEEQQQQEESAACIGTTKEEGVSEEEKLLKGQPSRSRARRKSKPRKSS